MACMEQERTFALPLNFLVMARRVLAKSSWRPGLGEGRRRMPVNGMKCSQPCGEVEPHKETKRA